jgi:molecular chaperone GrpE (heat shock protein)
LKSTVIMTTSPKELTAQNTKLRREQEQLIQNLLGVLDDLDRACEHWQQAAQDHAEMAVKPTNLRTSPSSSPHLWRRLQHWLRSWLRKLLGIYPNNISPPTVSTMANTSGTSEAIEIVESAHEGVEMIRRSLLDVLRKQQVIPLEVLGQPFDPTQMYALGRQECEHAAENTVVQEVVRGYLWQNRILRESQVMVAVKPKSGETPE